MDGVDGVLLYDGRILGTERAGASSLLVEGGRVVASGSRRELLRQRGRGTPLQDLRGRLVLPGLIDSHLHLAELARSTAGVDLRGARHPREVLARLRAWADAHPEGPILGAGWDQEQLEGGWPHRRWIDAVVPNRPVILDRVCRHVALVNSAALEGAGLLDPAAMDPPGGRIGRDPDGTPNGLLFEGALRPLEPLRSEFLRAQRGAMRSILEELARTGLTRVGAMSVGREELELLVELDRERPLPVGVDAYLQADRWAPSELPAASTRSANVTVAGVKAHLDGALGPRTAWLAVPYADAPEERGLPAPPEGGAPATLETASRRGLAIALHAIGDRAVERALDILAVLRPSGGGRIEHASVTPPPLPARLRRSGATVVIQPAFRWSDRWLLDRLGPRRARFAHAFRALLEAGVPLAGSSDAPIESPDPWDGLRAAIRTGRGDGMGRALTVGQALGLYTAGGARALGRAEVGHLRAGASADLLVIGSSRWPESIGMLPAAIRSVWRGGRCEVERGPSARPRSR